VFSGGISKTRKYLSTERLTASLEDLALGDVIICYFRYDDVITITYTVYVIVKEVTGAVNINGDLSFRYPSA
jgi:hypothetical protein